MSASHDKVETIETAEHRIRRHQRVEAATSPAVAYAHVYVDGVHVAEHEHSRAQLLHPDNGAVIVNTGAGRWLVPSGHALWIPAGVRHSVDAVGRVEMQSVYVKPDAVSGLPDHLHVTGITPLMRSLIAAAVGLGDVDDGDLRAAHLLGALIHEIPHLPERPLGLPLPAHPRINRLARAFLAAPSAHPAIDSWAAQAGMSRRGFTRLFRQETGLSLSAWRQQASVMAALPRLAAGETVTAVALDLGYDSIPAFTTMFGRVMGAPPKAYVRRQSQQ